jgi:EAL domain-containing protein (putative c-di-GMP-specific phosphodiesterase class I)
VEFEITENDLMLDPEKALETLRRIRALNIDLAIDDFGMGYSSFSYLKKFPITKLKIDQSFIKDLPHDDEDIAISKAIIVLANSLNINVIAEGVETKEQKEFLLQNNCKNIQGYFYSKPITASELEEKFLKI